MARKRGKKEIIKGIPNMILFIGGGLAAYLMFGKKGIPKAAAVAPAVSLPATTAEPLVEIGGIKVAQSDAEAAALQLLSNVTGSA